MNFSQKNRRGFAILVPLITTIILFGWLKFDTNILDTGITVGTVIGILNLGLWWLIYKRLVP